MARSPVQATVRRVWHGVAASPAGPLAWRLRLTGRSLRQRAGRALGRAASSLGGPDALGKSSGAVLRSSWSALPRSWQVKPAPPPIETDWPAPPTIDDPIV